MNNKLNFVMIMTALVIAVSQLPAQARTVTLGSGHSPSVAADGHGKMCMVFEGNDLHSGLSDIWCVTSLDSGKTWSQRQAVSPTIGVSTRPRVAIESSGAIDVVWTDTPLNAVMPDIFFSRSTDFGQTWISAVNITHSVAASRDPQISTGPDNRIHVVFTETRPENFSTRDIRYTFTSNCGETWSTNKVLENISHSERDSSEPAVAIDLDGSVHVVWKEENMSTVERPQIYYAKRQSEHWQQSEKISKHRKYSYHPMISCDGDGSINVGWLERSGAEGAASIWCTTLKNVPPQPLEPKRVSDDASIASAAEMINLRGNELAFAFPDRALGTQLPRICVKAFKRNSSNSTSIKFHRNSKIQLAPALTLTGNLIVVAWEERGLHKSMIKVKTLSPQRLR